MTTRVEEDRLEASVLFEKLKKREPKLGRRLFELVLRVLKHQDTVIRGLQERNSYLEQLHAHQIAKEAKHGD